RLLRGQMQLSDVVFYVVFISQELLSSEAEMAPVIQPNHIKAKLAQSFFSRAIAGDKGFSDCGHDALLKVEPWNRTHNLNFPANMQPRHKASYPMSSSSR
ncbi:MAG TPA: hypothetical protein VFR18_09060, partial [Terriglobia bacterium]|nr:hypothetical protein [Terriglobia bacterium]